MKRISLQLGALSLLLLFSLPAFAWETLYVEVKKSQSEPAWRDALAAKLKGKKEVAIEGGRIDVLTATQAIEVDRPNKWHEGLGQALHYAEATGKQGVLALTSYSQNPDGLRKKSRDLFKLVDKHCTRNGIQLIVLFPASGEAAQSEPQFWLNTNSDTRHNEDCRYFQRSKKGRLCKADEGKACKSCGG